MTHTFHKNHGKNLELSDGNQTIARIDRSNFHDGVALTSRPLRVGEMFEVMLCETSMRIAGKGGLEIGVTTNNPDAFKLPKDMTDCRENITIMFSGQDIVHNKSKKDLLNTSTYDLKVGEVLGVCLRQGGTVDFYVKKQCITSVETKYVGDIWGVVDLYGQASKASIYTGQAPPPPRELRSISEEEVVKLTESMARLMQAKEDDFKKAQGVLGALNTGKKTSKAHKEKLIAEMLTLNTAPLITDYVKFLKQQDTTHALGTYVLLLHLLVSVTDNSLPFCVALGKAGFLHICADELKLIKSKKSDESIRQTIIGSSMNVLHNCVKAPENVAVVRPLRLVEVVQHCIDSRKYKKHFVIPAVMTMSYVMEENEASLAQMSADTCDTVLEWLKKAISDENHKYEGWQAAELCDGLANLAADFTNLKNVVSRSGHVLFARLLLYGNEREKLSAVKALQAHVCRPSCKLISSVPKMLNLLRVTCAEGSSPCKEIAADVLKQLEDYVAKHPDEQPQDDRQRKKSGGGSASGGAGGGSGGEIVQSKTQAEKLAALVSALSMGGKTCPYREQCHVFLKQLNLPESFFTSQLDRCSCESCWNARGDDAYGMRGEPPKKYSLPKGWCRFGLRLPPKVQALQVTKKWHKAFHGTKQRFVQKMLELGELGLPGQQVLGGERIYERSIHSGLTLVPERPHKPQIFVSPSIHYAGSDCYATPERFAKDGKTYMVRVAFELFIAPRSYDVHAQSIGTEGQMDPQISNDEIEWTTSQQGSTVLYGLLVHME